MSKSRNPGKVLYRWGGTTATFFAYTHFSHDLSQGLLVALLPLIREGLGLNYLQSGLLLSAFTITSGLSQIPGGWLGDRVSRHIVIATGLGGVGLAALAVGLSSAYYPMLLILVVMGIFSGAYHPSAMSMLSGYFEEARRGKVLGLHMVGGSIGFAIGPVLGGLIAEMLGWRFAFIILSVPTLVAVPLVFKKFKQQESVSSGKPVNHASIDNGAPVKSMPRLSSLGQVLRPIVIVLAMAILMQLVAGSAMAFIPLYLVDKHYIAPAYAAMLVGMIRGAGIAGGLLGGWLSDKWSRRNTALSAIIATGPVLYLLTKLPFNVVLILVFVLFGIVMYMRQPAVQTLLMDTVPAQLRATVFGIYFFVGMEGMSLLQPIAGHFMDVFGIVQVFNIIALTSIALSLVALLVARRPRLH